MVRRLVIAVLMIAAATGHAEVVRVFGSAGVESQYAPPDPASPLNRGNLLGLPDQTNVADLTAFAEAGGRDHRWKVRMKVRAGASDRAADRAEVGEAFVQVDVRPWLDLTAGRVIEKWGSGYAWNPTAFVAPAKSPTDPNDRRSTSRGVDMIRADVFARGTSVSLYAMDGAFAARAYRLIAETDVSIQWRRDAGGHRHGISVARVFGDALELHGEVASDRGVLRTVVGGQYTFPNNANLVVEMYHGGDGLSRQEWRDWEVSAGPAANRTYVPLRMGRDYAFVRLLVPGASNRQELELIAITNLHDGSTIARVTYTRKLRPNVSLYAIDTEFLGRGEFEYMQVKRAIAVGARLHF